MPALKEDALEEGVSVDAASVVGFFQKDGVCAAGWVFAVSVCHENAHHRKCPNSQKSPGAPAMHS
eukprot:scaffold123113_cov17-Tisochrysis_lutea.AAC.1